MAVNTYLKNYRTGVTLTRRVRFETTPEINVLSGTMFSGEIFTQVIGEPANYYEATAFLDRPNRDLLRAAHATGDLLEISVAQGVYYARIVSMTVSERLAAGLYRAVLRLAGEL